jgi:hypothetical protein
LENWKVENQFINIKLRRENKYCFGPRCMEMKVPHKRLIWFFNLLNEVPELQSNCLRVLVLLHPNVKPRRGETVYGLNANQIDLNRIRKTYAARKQSVESVFESFKPTIAITYMTSAPSLREVRLSLLQCLLAPSYNEERSMSLTKSY